MEKNKAHSSNLGKWVCKLQAGKEREIIEVYVFILVLPVLEKRRVLYSPKLKVL